MPALREGDRFLVDLVEADEVEMVREGCRAVEVWRVSELRGLDGARLREAAAPGGAMERLVGKGKTGKTGKIWVEVVRRVAQTRGGRLDAMGRVVRAGAGSRCNRPLGAWMRAVVSDWSLVAWTEEGEAILGIPQSGPGSRHVVCKQLGRVEGQLPRWMGRGPSQSELRRQLWKVGAGTVEVKMSLDKVWDASAERLRVSKGGVWPVARGKLCAGGRRGEVGAGRAASRAQ